MMHQDRVGPIVWTVIIGMTCVLLVLIQHALWLVLPFIFGTVIYYMLLGPMQRLLRAGFTRSTSSILVFLMFFAIIALLVVGALSLYTMPGGTEGLKTTATRYLDGGFAFVRHTTTMMERKFTVASEMHLTQLVNDTFNKYTSNFAQRHLAAFLVTTASWFPTLILSPFLAFFFLRDGLRFKKFLARAVPNAYFERTLFLIRQVDQTARRYFGGMLKLTVLDTFTLGTGLWIIGVSTPLLLGFVAALLAWIPFVGPIAGCVLVVLVAATDTAAHPLVAYGAIGVFVVARGLDAFVYMPLTLGRSLKMHPMITVIMIFIGGTIAGVPGLMLVLPVMGVVMVVGETLGRLMTNPRLRARHEYAKLLRERQASADLEDL
jgi:predicted PurR-regulated permease PerM